MITAMSLTNGTLTVIVDGGAQILTARNDNPRWAEILEAFKSQNHTRILTLLSLKSIVEEYTRGSLSVNSTGVTFGGQPIHTVDANRVMAFLRDGLPYQPIANYMARCRKNQSARAIAELYPFLEHRNMPLTEEGFIIAYKGVRSTFYSVMGNTKTVVLQGVTDTEGHILNTVGTTIEIERSSCDDDFRNGCSFGLHAGSLAYAKGWGERVILIEIDPADVVSVPEDCSCQKLRCCKYRVIGEYTGPMPDTYTTEFGTRDNTNPADEDGEDTCDCGSDDCVECNPDYDPSDEDTCAGCGYPKNGCACQVAEAEARDNALAAQGQAVNQDGKVVQECPKCHAFDCVCEPVTIKDTLVGPRVREILVMHLGIGEETITNESNLTDFGCDSLDGVELVMAVEEEFGFELTDEEAESLYPKTVGEIIEFIRGKTCIVKVNPNAVSNGNGDDYETEYLEGMQAGIRDLQAGTPKYLLGDETGADSPAHASQIKGYLNGYFGSQP